MLAAAKDNVQKWEEVRSKRTDFNIKSLSLHKSVSTVSRGKCIYKIYVVLEEKKHKSRLNKPPAAAKRGEKLALAPGARTICGTD